jgi:hypothetical protein
VQRLLHEQDPLVARQDQLNDVGNIVTHTIEPRGRRLRAWTTGEPWGWPLVTPSG